MSWFTGDDGTRYELFGAGGGETLAADLGIPLLGQVPLVTAVRQGGDEGRPIVAVDPQSETAQAFSAIAATLAALGPRPGLPAGAQPALGAGATPLSAHRGHAAPRPLRIPAEGHTGSGQVILTAPPPGTIRVSQESRPPAVLVPRPGKALLPPSVTNAVTWCGSSAIVVAAADRLPGIKGVHHACQQHSHRTGQGRPDRGGHRRRDGGRQDRGPPWRRCVPSCPPRPGSRSTLPCSPWSTRAPRSWGW